VTDWLEMPAPGSVKADLETLKQYIGARNSNDDELLKERLFVAREHIFSRIKDSHRAQNDIQEAILLLASRLYKRRQSPEGVVGFGGEGGLVRIIAGDPDIIELLEKHLNLTDAGIA
jgi:Phage gp6-like head-tail connector protein